jgi:hypothetical protein
MASWYRMKRGGRFQHPCRFGCGRWIKTARMACYACVLATLGGENPGPETLAAERAQNRKARRATLPRQIEQHLIETMPFI